MLRCSHWLKARWLGAGQTQWRSCDCGSGCGLCGNAEGLGRRQSQACSATASGGAPGLEHVGGTEEPDCGKFCKESATDDQGAEQRSTVQARTGLARPDGRRDRGQPAESGSVGVAVPRAFKPHYGLDTSPTPCRKRPPTPPGQGPPPDSTSYDRSCRCRPCRSVTHSTRLKLHDQ